MTPEQEEELNHAVYAYGTSRSMTCDSFEAYEVVRKLVERFIAEAREAARPKWISVEVTKPAVEEAVLLYSEEDHCHYVGWLAKLIEGPECYINEYGQIDNITHWIPLPEVKEGEK